MKTNELIYKCSKEVNDTVIYVTIRLNDECNNGHNDFSITGEVYQNGILEQLKGSAHVEIIDNIIELNEATILAKCYISIDDLIEIADSRYELYDLAKMANEECDKRYPSPIEKQKPINYKAELIALLGLRHWATKEDIINELNELL